MNADQQKENKLTLDLLGTIEQNDEVSQRHLAKEMGVALGLANTYLKRCVKKGWVKITNAPANRYLYYVTPQGFAEKARLTGEFLTTSLTLVRQSGDAYVDLYKQCVSDGYSQVVFVGLSDLTEMAYLRALDANLTPLGVYNPIIQTEDLNYRNMLVSDKWFGLSIVFEVSPEWLEDTAFIITALACESELQEKILQSLPEASFYKPSFLAGAEKSEELTS